jgi:hypothetical protein
MRLLTWSEKSVSSNIVFPLALHYKTKMDNQFKVARYKKNFIESFISA